ARRERGRIGLRLAVHDLRLVVDLEGRVLAVVLDRERLGCRVVFLDRSGEVSAGRRVLRRRGKCRRSDSKRTNEDEQFLHMILRRAVTAHILIYDTERAADITSGQDWAGRPCMSQM